MSKFVKLVVFALSVSGITAVQAAVVPEYATNIYQNHELSRAEQKCLDEGYKITYANCSNQTAPAERCPHHDAYYRSCSQEQWCRNNNYSFLATDCKAPFYPFKMCANKYPLFRVCQENIDKACTEAGFVNKSKCQLTDKRCPYSTEYGVCCDSCPNFAYALDAVPQGYVAAGETCTTCEGIVKTNVIPDPCDGFQNCQFGPMTSQTPSCLQGSTMLYSACKTSAEVCREKGYVATSCSVTDDSADCPENNNFKLCTVNCFKRASVDYPAADVIAANITDPIIDLTKTQMRSLVGMPQPSCQNQIRPEVTLHINQKNMDMYANLFDREIENINFNLIFDEPLPLYANGKLKNVKITASGELPECPLQASDISISGVVSFNNIPTLCSNFKIAQGAKLLSTGGINGNIDMERDASLGLKGDLNGAIKAKSYTEIFIKGALRIKDNHNSSEDSESVVFGCNSKVKIESGIVAETASVYLKQWTSLDTPSIKLVSTSDNPKLPSTLASVHMYKYVKLFNAYGDTVYPLAENTQSGCDDRYYIHLGSAADTTKQSLTIEPSNTLENKWQCRSLNYKQQQCD